MAGVRVALAALALGACVQAAHGALFDDNEARKRIVITNERIDRLQKDLETRLAAVEQQAKNQGLDLFGQLEQLKADVSRIRGQLEVLTHELAEAQKRQRDLYVDLDSRLRKLEAVPAAPSDASAVIPPGAGSPGGSPTATSAGAGSPGGTPTANSAGMPVGPGATGGTPPATSPGMPVVPGSLGGPSATASPAGATPMGTPLAAATPSAGGAAPVTGTLAVPATPPAAAEQRIYDSALDHFKRGDYASSILGFGGFVKTFPRSPLAPSAQYWIGNAQFARKDYRASIAAQRQLIVLYPDSAKVPDALLNIASAQAELGDSAASRRTLDELITKYPQSESAGKAKQRLGRR